MPVKYKVTEKTQPGVTGGGQRKFYALPVMNGELTLEDLTKNIEKISTASGADIRGVLYALVDVAIDGLANGSIIRMGELGSLRISLSSEGKIKPGEVNAAAVKNLSIVFTPGKRIKKMLKNAKLQKV